MMNLEDREIEDIDSQEEYELVPFEPMMYGYGQKSMNPSMSMNPNMDMNPNIGMYPSMRMDMNPNMGYMEDENPDMDMDPWMGMNPWTGMNQFNQGMFMNDPNLMGMMYGDGSMSDYSQDEENFRQVDKYDEYNNSNKFNPKYNDVDSIVRRIERYNPAIFRILTRYGMSYPEARGVVRRIVRLTLMYSEG